MMKPVLVTPPDALPISVGTVRARLRVDVAEDDDTFAALIQAATGYLDGFTGVLGRALVTQVWRQDFSGFSPRIRLPFGPVSRIVAIDYFDSTNVSQALDDSAYVLHTDPGGPFLEIASGYSLPSTYARSDAVAVQFEVGTDPEHVPAALKQAILLLVGHWFENREIVGDRTAELPFSVSALITPYRRIAL